MSGAVYAVCIVIALIMIYARAQGRSRRFGTLGVLALLLCIAVGRLNGSVAPWLAVQIPSHLDYYGLGMILVAALGVCSIVLLVLSAVAGRAVARSNGGR